MWKESACYKQYLQIKRGVKKGRRLFFGGWGNGGGSLIIFLTNSGGLRGVRVEEDT